MKIWFIIGAVLAIFLTACAGETINNQDSQEQNNSETDSQENNETDEPTQESNSQICCQAMTASCLACQANMTIEEYCEENPETAGCEELNEEADLNQEEVDNYEVPTTPLSGVTCEGNKLTFTITNTIQKTMEFDLLSFPSPPEKTQIKVNINGYDSWNNNEYFSKQNMRDCTDGTLEPQESIICTLEPVPIIKENDFSRNTISVKAERINVQQTFTCS